MCAWRRRRRMMERRYFDAPIHTMMACASRRSVGLPWRQGMMYDAGLFFLAYQRDPRAGFIKIYENMSKLDALNQFTTHTGGGLFVCPGGIHVKASLSVRGCSSLVPQPVQFRLFSQLARRLDWTNSTDKVRSFSQYMWRRAVLRPFVRQARRSPKPADAPRCRLSRELLCGRALERSRRLLWIWANG